MFNFLKPRPKQVPPADAVALLDELNALIAAGLVTFTCGSGKDPNLYYEYDHYLLN